MEVIILCGGFGSRLRSVVSDVPKPMANINDKPFLEHLLKYLTSYNITNIILSVGYKQEIIKNHFGNSFEGVPITYSSEDEPLGTGGAIKKALSLVSLDNVLIVNGDTMFKVDLDALEELHNRLGSSITIGLKHMENVDRYGAVKVKNNKVVQFEEKKLYKEAYINCGTYMIKKNIFDDYLEEDKFSFEEYIEQNLTTLNVNSFVSNESYFIDIGIPLDYEKAKIDLKTK